ncbi:hypothetical protein JZ751_013273, partial [Albula glossodonta]
MNPGGRGGGEEKMDPIFSLSQGFVQTNPSVYDQKKKMLNEQWLKQGYLNKKKKKKKSYEMPHWLVHIHPPLPTGNSTCGRRALHCPL